MGYVPHTNAQGIDAPSPPPPYPSPSPSPLRNCDASHRSAGGQKKEGQGWGSSVNRQGTSGGSGEEGGGEGGGQKFHYSGSGLPARLPGNGCDIFADVVRGRFGETELLQCLL